MCCNSTATLNSLRPRKLVLTPAYACPMIPSESSIYKHTVTLKYKSKQNLQLSDWLGVPNRDTASSAETDKQVLAGLIDTAQASQRSQYFHTR